MTKMPSLEPEDQLWSGLQFHIVDEEELAHQQAVGGDRVHKHTGVWWRELKFGFCQPCFVYAEVDSREACPNQLRSPAGYMHVATPGSPTNLAFRTYVRENLSEYSVQTLGKWRRRTVRRVLASLTVRPVESLGDLLGPGYEVYASWHTRVGWGADKTRRSTYNAWITRVFHQPNQMVLGAYRKDGTLVAFMLPKAVRHVVTPSFVASHTDALSESPNDALYHAFLSIARQTRGLAIAGFGPVSTKMSLDKFKLAYCEIRESPAYLWLNPMLRIFAGNLLRRRYPWIAGSTSGAPAVPKHSLPEIARASHEP